MPERTTVVFPVLLKRRAVACARLQGISFGEFVRQAVASRVSPAAKTPARKRKKTGDPFLDNLVTFDDGGPPDLSTRIDEILYGPDL